MRDKETLVREFGFMAKCSEETAEAWWKSLNSEEKSLIAEHYKEMLEMLSPLLSARVISSLQSMIDKLNPEMQDLFEEVTDMLAGLEGSDDDEGTA